MLDFILDCILRLFYLIYTVTFYSTLLYFHLLPYSFLDTNSDIALFILKYFIYLYTLLYIG